ncbi:hypothetical protein AKJ16_DCAP16840 [Drosera capensis]
MATSIYHQAFGTLHTAGPASNILLRFPPRGNGYTAGRLRTESCVSSKRSSGLPQASTSQMPVLDQVSSPSEDSNNGIPKKSNKNYLFHCHFEQADISCSVVCLLCTYLREKINF